MGKLTREMFNDIFQRFSDLWCYFCSLRWH